MFQKTLRFLILAVLAFGFLWIAPLSAATAARYAQDTELVKKLTDKAVQSLRDEYDVLVKGNQPTRGLIPHQDEWRRERSRVECLNDVLARIERALRDGLPS